MGEQAHVESNAIVLGGARKHLGMPGFGDAIAVEDSAAIQAYVIQQAWKLYEESAAGLPVGA